VRTTGSRYVRTFSESAKWSKFLNHGCRAALPATFHLGWKPCVRRLGRPAGRAFVWCRGDV